jgi:hypothetical protein
MAAETSLTTVRCWFGDAQFAALDLPDGRFGPPQESRHQLTWSELEGTTLVIELDHALVLTFERPRTLACIDGTLVIKDFDRLRFLCRGWRGIRAEAREYHDGTVSLLPPMNGPRPRAMGPALGNRRKLRQTGQVPISQ